WQPGGGHKMHRGAFDVGFDDTMRRRIPDGYYSGAHADPCVGRITSALPCEPGYSFASTRRELVNDREGYRSAYVTDIRRPARLDDSIYTGRAFGGARGHGIGVVRAWGDPAFSADDRDLMQVFTEEVFARFALPDAPIEDVNLSPRERQTLRLLC